MRDTPASIAVVYALACLWLAWRIVLPLIGLGVVLKAMWSLI